MNIACLIIGIDGWEEYTRPLLESIERYEAVNTRMVVIDNASQDPYWPLPNHPYAYIHRTRRLSYAKAINIAAGVFDWTDWFHGWQPDWYIVLSNDVLCTAPFAHLFDNVAPNKVLGPCLKRNEAGPYLEGWCVAASRQTWDALGGWDANYQGSSWEDVDFSTSAIAHGNLLVRVPLPFVHLDQRQRFGIIPNYWSTERANIEYFQKKHGVAW